MSTFSQEQQNINDSESVVFDLIIILDESGSMEKSGKEPIQSVNIYVNDFKKEAVSEKTTFTFVTFNINTNIQIKDQVIKNMEEIKENSYQPNGGTAIYDAICYTIKEVLGGVKPNNKIMVIITDGEENSSLKYNKEDVKKIINLVESKHEWKIVFLGANIDSFEEGTSININENRTGQFNQNLSGDLLKLCRATSFAATQFTRSISQGDMEVDLKVPPPEVNTIEKLRVGIPLGSKPLSLKRSRAEAKFITKVDIPLEEVIYPELSLL